MHVSDPIRISEASVTFSASTGDDGQTVSTRTAGPPRPIIDDSDLVVLRQNVHAQAKAKSRSGHTAPATLMGRMIVALKIDANKRSNWMGCFTGSRIRPRPTSAGGSRRRSSVARSVAPRGTRPSERGALRPGLRCRGRRRRKNLDQLLGYCFRRRGGVPHHHRRIRVRRRAPARQLRRSRALFLQRAPAFPVVRFVKVGLSPAPRSRPRRRGASRRGCDRRRSEPRAAS